MVSAIHRIEMENPAQVIRVNLHTLDSFHANVNTKQAGRNHTAAYAAGQLSHTGTVDLPSYPWRY